MPRRPGVYFYRGHFVTKLGCGDGPPVKLCPAKGKSDREAMQAAEAELRRLVVERDRGRAVAKPAGEITVEELVVKFLEWTRAEREPATHNDYRAMLHKLVYGFPGSGGPGRRTSLGRTRCTSGASRSPTGSPASGPAT